MERQAKDGTFYQKVGEDEWQPVTRVAKDGTSYTKVGADEWRPTVEPEKPQVTKLESAARGAAQGATGGWADEIVAGAGAIYDDLQKFVSGDESGPKARYDEQGRVANRDELNSASTYEKRRDSYRKGDDDAYNANPLTYGASNIVGAVASPLNKLAKGASLVKAGATLGGINAAGASEADSALGVAGDTLKGAAVGVAAGKGTEWAASKVGQAFRKFVETTSPAQKKASAAEIIEAARRVGVDVTPGMLDDTGFITRLESSLSKSPSVFGQSVKRAQDRVTNRMREAGEDALEGASNLSPAELGDKFKGGVTSRVAERLDPIKAVFDDVGQSTRSMELSERSLEAVKRNIEGLDVYRLTDGAGKGRGYVEMIGRMKNANDVKTVMTLLNDDIRASMGAEKQVLVQIKDKMKNLEENSITRAAIKAAKDSRMKESTGKEIGREIVTDLREARQGYRGLMDDLKQVGEVARLKGRSGPMSVLDEIENIPSEQITARFMKLDNSRQMKALAEKFPEEFDLLRGGRLREIAEKSIDASQGGEGAHNTARFLREVAKLNPEAKRTLFGDKARLIDDIATLHQNMPKNFNPSGTGSEVNWHNVAYANIKDIPNYLVYRTASSNLGKKISDHLIKDASVQRLYGRNPQLFQNVVEKIERNSGVFALPRSAVPAAAVAEGKGQSEVASIKGERKWVLDGVAKLTAHAEKQGLDPAFIEKLVETKAGVSKLIHAADLKVGSPAMNRLIEKSRSAKEGDR